VHGIQADCYAEDVRIYWPRMEPWDAPSVREYFESGGTSFPTAVLPKAEANAEKMIEEKPDKVNAEHEGVAKVPAKVEAPAVPERLAVIAAKEAAEEAKVEAVAFVAAVVKAAEEAKVEAATKVTNAAEAIKARAAAADPFDIPLPQLSDPFDVPLSGSGTPRAGPQVNSPAGQPPSESFAEPWSFKSLSESLTLSESPLEIPSSAAADGQQVEDHGQHMDLEQEVVDVPLGTPQAAEEAAERTDAHVSMLPLTPPATRPLSFFQRLFSCGPILRAPPSTDENDVVTISK